MDLECVELLPRVCKVLAALGKSPPDDTSLEKLLDWLTGLKTEGKSLLETCPCLSEFISTVTHNVASEPSVLSFTLKLTGLLAANEDSFRLLQERSLLGLVYDSQRWQEAGLWEDPCIRIGWIQGLKIMLQQPLALHFLVETGVIKPLLQLQTDSSLFVASAANQMLATILVFSQPDSSEGFNDIEKTNTNGGRAGNHDKNVAPTVGSSHDYSTVAVAVMNHLRESLVPKENANPHQCLQSLKLVALLLTQARPPLRDRVLTTVLEPLEDLVTAGSSQQTPLLLDVLLIAYSRYEPSEQVPDQAVGCLISRMLDACKPPEVIHAAATVLQREHRGLDHTAKAVGILLLPFDIITGVTLLDSHAAAQAQRSSVAELLNSKTPCISVLCACLTHTPQIALMPADFLPCPPVQVVTAVLSMLQVCGGHAPAPSPPSGSSKACRNVIGSGKVQKCLLQALAALSAIPGAVEKFSEVSTVLIQYLHSPDSDPTVLQKSYQALLKWMGVYNNLPSMADLLIQDLLSVVKKRACDLHWEVRDSTVEFLGQLAGVCVGVSEALLDCSITPLLTAALCDPESYVRASAVTALAQTLTHSWQQGAAPTQEQTDIVSKLLEILSKDTEAFARRAAVRYFLSWYSAWASSASPPSAPPSLLTNSVRTVLSQGSADLDWEVKVHTLELAQLLLDKTLGSGDARGDARAAALGGGFAEGAVPDLAWELSALVEQGVLSALLSGLFDCDRPVALKACRLLAALREAVARPSSPGASDTRAAPTAVAKVSCELEGRGWGREVRALLDENCNRTEEVPERLTSKQGLDRAGRGVSEECRREGVTGTPEAGDCVSAGVCEVLRCLGLDERLAVLAQSSDHVQNSALSLLQDILTAGDRRHHSDTHPAEDVIVDCY